MTRPPQTVWVYHITHVDNLPAIIQAGGLWSDAEMRRQNISHGVIGYDHIKERRLSQLSVPCHPGTMVGDYVPFYFCPRSVMLYKINQKTSDLTYTEGQDGIIHLRAKMADITAWADGQNVPWAFSTSTAAAFVVDIYNTNADLNKIDWEAVDAHYWSSCRDKKQAEFLMHGFFPFELFLEIGTRTSTIKKRVEDAVAAITNPPTVATKPEWYY